VLEVRERVVVLEVIVIMKVAESKMNYTLARIEAYWMCKACRVDNDTDGM